MKILAVCLLILIGCSSREEESQDKILKLQSIWNSRDIHVAIKKITGLRKVEEDSDYEIYGIDDKIKIFSLSITVLKKDKKIITYQYT